MCFCLFVFFGGGVQIVNELNCMLWYPNFYPNQFTFFDFQIGYIKNFTLHTKKCICFSANYRDIKTDSIIPRKLQQIPSTVIIGC